MTEHFNGLDIMKFEELQEKYNALKPGNYQDLVELVQYNIDLLSAEKECSLEKFKSYIAIRSNYVTALYAIGQYREALKYGSENISLIEYSMLSEKDKEYWSLSNYISAGYAAYELKELKKAMHYLSEAFELDPDSKKLKHYITNAASMKNRKLKTGVFLVAITLLITSFFMDSIFTFPGMVMLYIVIFLLFLAPFVITKLNKHIHTRLN